MPPKKLAFPDEAIDNMIREIRGVRVILDSDLAALYGVSTKRLNEQFRRNRKRFPEDFVFQLSAKESAASRSQFATGSPQDVDSEAGETNRSQFATGSQKHRDPRLRPYAFTEHGALQAANILNSPDAIRMSVFVIRAFVKMREALQGTPDLARKLVALEKKLTGRLDVHEAAIVGVLQEIMKILNPPPSPPPLPKPRIGFNP